MNFLSFPSKPALILLCCVLGSCSQASDLNPTSESVERTTEEPRSSEESQSGQINEIKKQHERILVELAGKAGVLRLKSKELKSDEMEIRIWGDVGRESPKGIFLENRAEHWNAIVAAVHQNKNNTQISRRQSTLRLIPKSGWQALARNLNDTELTVPLLLLLDLDGRPPIPDEGAVYVEVKRGDRYDYVYYRQSTQSRDGLKIIQLCKSLETDFEIVLGCIL